METFTPDQRRELACGYEPHDEDASGWAPDITRLGWQGMDYAGAPPTTCPGYTTKLHDVVEVIRARGHWKTGQLVDAVGGPLTEQFVAAIEILDAEANRCENFYATPVKHGGGKEES